MTGISKDKTRTTQVWARLVEWLLVAMMGSSMATAAESKTEMPALMHWTSAIDARAAFIASALSLLILFAVSKMDFKSPLGIWGGRFIIFALVILNIALWSTQV